jgi:hypothetical protein
MARHCSTVDQMTMGTESQRKSSESRFWMYGQRMTTPALALR